MNCRHCQGSDLHPFVDLGSAPPSNAYLNVTALHEPEKWFPLQVRVCANCWLVQTDDYAHFSELFAADYAYFSSFSSSWLDHARAYVDAMVQHYALNERSQVVEIAANDGYLLQYVVERGIPCLGVEPTRGTAAAARAKGIPVEEAFFGLELAHRLHERGYAADLMIANNVLAHVPDINDFASGFTKLLKPGGIATFEFPHLQRLVQENQFDTIYHEHFSYLSLTAVTAVFSRAGLSAFDVEELPTHGGSLRVYAQRADSKSHPANPRLEALLRCEAAAGLTALPIYAGFQARTDEVKNGMLRFLLDAKRSDHRVAAYGAAAKGNTLLNYAGVRPDLLGFVVDRNPAKQGRFLPGSRIPIVSEARLREERPAFVLILPWNLREEVMQQLDYIREWGGRFVWAVPTLTIA